MLLGSKLDKKIWSLKVDKKNIFITGHPKYDKKWQIQFSKKKEKKYNKIVFVLKNIIDESSLYFTLRYLNELYKICSQQNYFLDIKVPPFAQKKLLSTIKIFKKNKDEKKFMLSDQNIFFSLNDADLLINFNVSATTLNSILLDIPVIQLPTINKIKGKFGQNVSIYTKYKLAYQVNNINQLENKINFIMKNKKKISNHLKYKQNKYFLNFKSAAKNVKNVLMNRIENS